MAHGSNTAVAKPERRRKSAIVTSLMATSAIALASLVATPMSSAADREVPTPLASGSTGVGPSETRVVGLIVEHSGSSRALGQAAGAVSKLGVGATAATLSPGSGVLSFSSATDLATAERALARVERLPGVESVELNVLHTAQVAPPGGAPRDPSFFRQHGVWDMRDSFEHPIVQEGPPHTWHLPPGGFGTKAPALWPLTKGSKSTVVAVVDSGSTPHPDLDQNTVKGYDMVTGGGVIDPRDGNGRDPDPTDEGDWANVKECDEESNWNHSSWHGTHVAGIIAAIENTQGVVGNAPGVRLQHVRALAKCGSTTRDVADAITWASGGVVPGVPPNETPAKVINVSIAGKHPCQELTQKAIDGARERGSVIIVAAGNFHENAVDYQPGNCRDVITVASTDWIGTKSGFSNWGSNVDLSAPGGAWLAHWWNGDAAILSTTNSSQVGPAHGTPTWNWDAGTSMAAAGVSGVAALIASLRPQATAVQLETAILASISDFPDRPELKERDCGSTTICGKGIIDATKAATAWLETPKVTGAQVGKVASVDPLVVAPKARFTYQWLRNGKKIKGATKEKYTVKKSDIGKKLSVHLTAQLSGFPSSEITSKAAKVTKLKPTVTAKLKPRTVKTTKSAKVVIKVRAGKLTKRPTGTLTVSYGAKSTKARLAASDKGKLKVTLPTLTKGSYKVRVRFTPSGSLKKYVRAASSPTVRLKVK